jgi:septum formation protein
MTRIILASTSKIRMRILTAAGVPFETARPGVDEAALKEKGLAGGLSLDEVTQRLADAKALAVSTDKDALVIGSDQMLEFDGAGLDKPASMGEARTRLLKMQGRSHALINAVSIARAGAVRFRHLERTTLHLRPASAEEIDLYLDAAGDEILTSVAAYQVEALGSRLFERIEGDYFAVLGLSLFPLLRFLRAEGALSF